MDVQLCANGKVRVQVCVIRGGALNTTYRLGLFRRRREQRDRRKVSGIEKMRSEGRVRGREGDKEREQERWLERQGEGGREETDCWKNVIKSVYGVLSLTHKSRTTCSLEVITPGSRDILHVNSESLHLKLGVKIPFPPIDKLNHLQG